MRRLLHVLLMLAFPLCAWWLVFGCSLVFGVSVRSAWWTAVAWFLPMTLGLLFVTAVVTASVYSSAAVRRLYRGQQDSLPPDRVGSLRTLRDAGARGVRGTVIVDLRTMNGAAFVWWVPADVVAEALAVGVDVESGSDVWRRMETHVGALAMTDTFTPWCARRHFDAERGDAVLLFFQGAVVGRWRWMRLRASFRSTPVVYTNTSVQQMAAEFRAAALPGGGPMGAL